MNPKMLIEKVTLNGRRVDSIKDLTIQQKASVAPMFVPNQHITMDFIQSKNTQWFVFKLYGKEAMWFNLKYDLYDNIILRITDIKGHKMKATTYFYEKHVSITSDNHAILEVKLMVKEVEDNYELMKEEVVMFH